MKRTYSKLIVVLAVRNFGLKFGNVIFLGRQNEIKQLSVGGKKSKGVSFD